MKKIFLSTLLVFALVFSVLSVSYAAENVAAKDVAVAGEDGEVQVKTVPIVKGNVPSYNSAAVNSPAESVVVEWAESYDFYPDSDTFEVHLGVSEPRDLRGNLKVEVVDENNTVVAQQVSSHYGFTCEVVYTMKRVKPVSDMAAYYLRFTYTGKYRVEYAFEECMVFVNSDTMIKNIEVIDRDANAFRITLANAVPGTEYTLFYDDLDGDSPARKNATLASDMALYVEFGEDSMFAMENAVYLCPGGSENSSNQIDSVRLHYFDIPEEDEGEISIEGIYCSKYISNSATYVWVGFQNKGFSYQGYSQEDASKVNVYMFDLTSGKTAGTRADTEYYPAYGEIECKVTITEKLDKTHKYIMVFDDGYSVRVWENITIISDPFISNINTYDINRKWMEKLPENVQSFYVEVSSDNISDPAAISVSLIDGDGKTVATSAFDNNTYYYLMTATAPVKAGEYKLVAAYNDVTYSERITVVAGEAPLWQMASDVTIFNGKTYIEAAITTDTLNPANLTYKVIYENGTEKTARYHRALYTDGNDKYFVVVVDEELTDINSDNQAHLRMYNGSSQIFPTYENNVCISYFNEVTSPFIYNQYNITDTTLEMFLEGFTNASTVSINAFDDVTNAGVTVNAVSVLNNKAVFNKTDLNRINTKVKLFREDSWGYDKEGFVEVNGEYMKGIWLDGYDSIGNILLDDEFSFSRKYAQSEYEVLNLPSQTYAYYKLASSEAELVAMPYSKIKSGELYRMSNQQGRQTVYAQFKTATGAESPVMTASIYVDLTAPTLTMVSELPETLLISTKNIIRVPFEVDVSEKGYLHCNFYDENDELIGYERTRDVASGNDKFTMTFLLDDYNYTDAVKVIVYMEDGAGNNSVAYEFPVSFEYTDSEYVYTVYFVTNCDEKITPVQVGKGKSVAKPAKISNGNLQLAGWYTNKSFTRLYDFSASVTCDITLYARWTNELLKIANVAYYPGDYSMGVTVEAEDALKEMGGTVIVAIYDGNYLTDMKVYAADEVGYDLFTQLPTPLDHYTVKAFCWTTLNNPVAIGKVATREVY